MSQFDYSLKTASYIHCLAVAIGVTFLYDMFGWAAFVGIAVVPLASPFSYLVSYVTYRKSSLLSIILVLYAYFTDCPERL